MEISLEGMGRMAVTMTVEESVKPGMAVALTGNGAVGMGAAGDPLCGVALHVEEDGAGAVQLDGLATAPYAGTAPKVGLNALACDGAGAVKVASEGRSCLVLSVDTENKTAVVKL